MGRAPSSRSEKYRVENDVVDRRTALGPEPDGYVRSLDEWHRATDSILDAIDVPSPAARTALAAARVGSKRRRSRSSCEAASASDFRAATNLAAHPTLTSAAMITAENKTRTGYQPGGWSAC